jgi:hypothetical protein
MIFINFPKSHILLSHSAAQKPRLVQVFLNSHLCLLHFVNFISNNINGLYRLIVKR